MRRITTASLALTLAATGALSGAAAALAQDGSDLKIGVVTDVGTIDDRNFNQYTWEGAQAGAEAIGAPAPQYAISQTSTDIGPNILGFVDQEYDIIVTIGFAAGEDTIKAAKDNPDIKFIGVDQAPCIDENGDPDATFTCAGDPSVLLPNLQGINWREQQPGYLAGIVAAGTSATGHIAAVGGTAVIPAVVNYIEGYANGAKSVNPDVNVTVTYISGAPDAAAFNDPAGGQAVAQQLLAQDPDIDVMFQVAGKTGNGVLQAACDAGIWGIGVDVDQCGGLSSRARRRYDAHSDPSPGVGPDGKTRPGRLRWRRGPEEECMRRITTASLALTLAATGALTGAAAAFAQDGSDLKIGVVTDVGTIDDRNFNQYTWEGAQAGAEAVGAPAPQYAISQTSTDIGPNILGFVDQQYDIIVTIGFAAGEDTIKAAKDNPDIKFIGIDQAPCIDENGDPDATFTCAGDPAVLLPNLQGINWREQQPGYLAGIVAAGASETGHIAAVGGTAVIPAVVNYIEGYANGAKSVNPDVNVTVTYISGAPGRSGLQRSRWRPGRGSAAVGPGLRTSTSCSRSRARPATACCRPPVTRASGVSVWTWTSTSPPPRPQPARSSAPRRS